MNKISSVRYENRNGELPKKTSYKEYDVNPLAKKKDRGKERLVIGKNGTAYYTNSHYKAFVIIK
ncbi:ribonuclease domain-containing protein [Lysinibacillus sp. NPDC092081]|uniref:ribonuclease domain-containing protein n=1 Tax=Lysinibacillus sp. NPDC092081 TaxID=3364131 RepID=UPI003826CFF8